MESGSRISYTRTLEEQTLVYLYISPPNLSMMLVWNNLADPHLSAFSDFARFSQTLTLKTKTQLGFTTIDQSVRVINAQKIIVALAHKQCTSQLS